MASAEKEMTTGWQFATQIEDDDELSKFEIIGSKREMQSKSSLLIEQRQIIPSMLDPAFEDEEMSPRNTELGRSQSVRQDND